MGRKTARCGLKTAGNPKKPIISKRIGMPEEMARQRMRPPEDGIQEVDDVAPSFKTEPGPPQIHLEGNRLVLTCLAEGSWPLEFKWILNDTEITTFSPEYKYIIPSLQRSNAGFYQCVVRNRMGALMQKKTEIQVAYMGNFEEMEQRKTVTQGKAAVLNSPVVSCYPRPQVTWFRDGYKIIPSSRM
ncbi:SDK1 protein, partial [Polypterus senegalus]